MYKVFKRRVNHIYNFFLDILYSIVSFIDWFNFLYIKNKLLDGYKTIEEIDISKYGIKVLTDTGFEPISYIYNTKPFEIYDITVGLDGTDERIYTTKCADKHMFFDDNYNIVYADELIEGISKIQTDCGIKVVSSVSHKTRKNRLNQVSMCDISVDSQNHRFYTNGILSHNSVTTAIFCLWTIIFRNDKMALLLSKSGAAGRDLLAKIKDMYRHLPFYLKPGVLKWNLSEIAFDNNSSMSTEAFSPTAGLGKTINFLVLDEFAWCPPNDVELFYNNIIPTITTDTNANICIISTQNGFNLFYKLFMGSVKGENIYANMTVNWWDVPNWDSKNNCWVKRDEKWRNEMVGVLGSEQNFEYQYGTQFLISDKCIVSREVMADIMDNAKMFIPLEKHHVYKDELLYYSLNNKYFKIKEDYIFSKDKYYIILIDLAEGAGGDYTVFNIFDIGDGEQFEQVAYWHSNKVSIDGAALEFWLMFGQVFDPEHTLFSIEWNTYGELFWNYIMALNEPDEYNGAANWRFNVIKSLEGIETGSVIMYKKANSNQLVPGLRWTHTSKQSACSLLRNKLSNKSIIINDLNTAVEIQNFEDKNSNGSYEAIYGHDDIVMTLTQIPEVEKTLRFKNLIETIQEEKIKQNYYNNIINAG